MSLEERVNRLERQNRWLRRAFAVSAMLLGCLVTTGAMSQSTVYSVLKTKQLDIIGPQGQARSHIFVTQSGQAILQFLDANGKVQLGIGCDASGRNGGAVNFWDGNDRRIGTLRSTGFTRER